MRAIGFQEGTRELARSLCLLEAHDVSRSMLTAALLRWGEVRCVRMDRSKSSVSRYYGLRSFYEYLSQVTFASSASLVPLEPV